MGTQIKMEHVGIVVNDLEKSLKPYQELLEVSDIEFEEVDVEGNRATIAFLPFGTRKVELIKPKDGIGLLAEFLRVKGEGIHHVAFEVEDIQAYYERMKNKGATFLWEGVRKGSRGSKVFFFRPEEFNGIYIEILEKAKH